MRGHEQHVERKIRLWVVQQERNRLRDSQPGRADAPAEELADPHRGGVEVRAGERWRPR